ncbi:MAG: carbohydrate kinase family protein [Paracoccaceae bacterium]
MTDTDPSGRPGGTLRSLHIGSAMIDVICIVAPENIERMSFSNESKSFLMLEAGRKIPAQSVTTHVGGGACNTAVALARRGWDAAVLARVGEDHNAGAVREHLDRNGVDPGWLATTPDTATGTSVMVASHDRNATIFVHRGANEGISTGDLGEAAFEGRDLVHIAPLSSRSADAFGEVAARGRRAGAFVSANPGIRQLTSRTGPLIEALANVDLLSINRVEAEALVPAMAARAEGPDPLPPAGAPTLLKTGLTAGGFNIGLLRFLATVREAGPRFVLLTDGTDGAWLAGPGCGPGEAIWRPSVKAKVAGTAGAGDSFTSTLTAALVEEVEPAQAMAEAAVNAAAVVSVVDTTAGLLTRDALAGRVAAAGEMALYEGMAVQTVRR